MKTKTCFIGGLCMSAIALCTFAGAQTPTPSTSPAKTGTRPFPFHGMISAVDQNASTFTISGKKASRVFKVTDKTVITKASKTASMNDITENEEASGSYWKNADGTLEAKMVKLGPMGAKKGKTSPGPSASPKISASPTR